MNVCSTLDHSVRILQIVEERTPDPCNRTDSVLLLPEQFPQGHSASLAPSPHIQGHNFPGQQLINLHF